MRYSIVRFRVISSFKRIEQIVALAIKYKKTAAQILIRYQIQRGHVVIPKSVTRARIVSNFDVFDFELSEDDIAQMDSFDCNGRICSLTE